MGVVCAMNGYCCTKTNIPIPKSDLFVPQINITKGSQKNNQKKILTSIKTMKTTKKKGLKRMTTEQFINDSEIIKNAKTAGANVFCKKKDITIISKNNCFPTSIQLDEEAITKNLNQRSLFKPSITIEKSKKASNQNVQKYKTNELKQQINLEISEYLMSSNEESNILNVILYHYLFHNTTKENLHFIMNEIKEFQIEEKSENFDEGDEACCVFLIKSGNMKFFLNIFKHLQQK